MKIIDLHNHTNFSYDGISGINALVENAIALGVDILGITDHEFSISERIFEYIKAVGDAKEKYKGKLHLDVFEKALENSRNPVCYNGDLRTVGEIRTFEAQFPQADAVMIGRGAVADPALLRKMRGGSAATREELQAFLQDLYHSYQEFYGQVGTAAQRMREVWFYLIHMFEDADKLNKKLRRFKSPGEYEAIEAAIFQELVLRTDSQGDLT